MVREQLPICVIVLNNQCLGLIRQQQEDFLDGNMVGALASGGFTSPDFHSIAQAYGLESYRLDSGDVLPEDVSRKIGRQPLLIEFVLPPDTMALPKTYFGESMLDQKPHIPVQMYREIETL